MKNLKNTLSFGALDFAVIQILLSIIAISLAGIVSAASSNVAKADFHKPILPAAGSDLKVCPVSFSSESCEKQMPRENSGDLEDSDILQALSVSPLLKTE